MLALRIVSAGLLVVLLSGCVDFSHKAHHDGVDQNLQAQLEEAIRLTLDRFQPDHETDSPTVTTTAAKLALWLQNDPELWRAVRSESIGAMDLKRITEKRLGHIRQRRGAFEPRPVVLWLGDHVDDLTPISAFFVLLACCRCLMMVVGWNQR